MDYKTSLEFIQSRRSLYPAQMDEQKRIPDEDIWKLLELANYAPNHKRTEPWRFRVFSDKKVHEFYEQLIRINANWRQGTELEKLGDKLRMKAQKVSHVIVIIMKRDKEERVPAREEEYATACAVQNILLGMNSLNIIGYWGTGQAAFSDEMKAFLKLDQADKCMGFLQLGVPKTLPPIETKLKPGDIKEKVSWD